MQCWQLVTRVRLGVRAVSWWHELLLFSLPFNLQLLDICNRKCLCTHTKTAKRCIHLCFWKWVGWILEKTTEPRELQWWWQQSLWQRRWKVKGVTVCLAMWVAAGGPYCSLATPESWRETSVTRRMERKEGSQRQPKVWVSCHLFWNSIKKSPYALLELPQWKIPLPGHGHTQSSKCLLYNPPSPSLSPAFVLFLAPAFLCTYSQLSSSKSKTCAILPPSGKQEKGFLLPTCLLESKQTKPYLSKKGICYFKWKCAEAHFIKQTLWKKSS